MAKDEARGCVQQDIGVLGHPLIIDLQGRKTKKRDDGALEQVHPGCVCTAGRLICLYDCTIPRS